jgi:hypothetical protein
MTWFVLTGAVLASQGVAFAAIGGRAHSRGMGALALVAGILFLAGLVLVYGGSPGDQPIVPSSSP